jgi:integrase
MKLFKPTFKDRRTGKTKRTPRWYLSFSDHLRRRQRIAGYEDRDQTVQLGALLSELVRCRQSRTTPDPQWLDRLESVPADIQRRLLDIDLCLPAWVSITRTDDVLAAWVDEFETWLRTSKTRSGYLRHKGHCDVTLTRVRSILAGCRFRRWEDITPGKIDVFLGGLDIKSSTHGGYVTSIKHFCRWCRRNGKASGDPVADLGRLSVPVKETRRPVEASELRPLLQGVLARGRRFSIDPVDRSVLYIVGLVTGYRKNELSWLTPESFDLDRAVVRLDGRHTKNHLDAVQPIPISLIDGLRAYLLDKPAKTRLWHPITVKSAVMLRRDAVAGGLTVDGDSRTLCFHSLRHSLRHWLVKAGIHESVIDAVLRHAPSSSDVGRRYYGHVDDADKRAAVESLPSIPWPTDLLPAKADTRHRQASLL